MTIGTPLPLRSFFKRFRGFKKVYIIPSKLGFKFVSINFLLLLISLSYANNMALIITFAMFTFLIIQMLDTHKTIQILDLEKATVGSDFEDNALDIRLFFKDETFTRVLQDINITIELQNHNKNSIRIRLKDQEKLGKKSACFTLPNLNRGEYKITSFIFHTNPKIKFFYVWKFERVNSRFFVYPKKLKDENSIKDHYNDKILNHGTDFDRHLQYSKGMPSKRIDWKILARKDQVLLRNFTETQRDSVEVNFEDFHGTKEERIQKITYTLDLLNNHQVKWTLVLPLMTIPAQAGADHFKKCLEALSVYK